MLDALYYALRFLIISTLLSLLTWVIVYGLTTSEVITGVAIGIVNAFVLFTTVGLFVDSKLDQYDLSAS